MRKVLFLLYIDGLVENHQAKTDAACKQWGVELEKYFSRLLPRTTEVLYPAHLVGPEQAVQLQLQTYRQPVFEEQLGQFPGIKTMTHR